MRYADLEREWDAQRHAMLLATIQKEKRSIGDAEEAVATVTRAAQRPPCEMAEDDATAHMDARTWSAILDAPEHPWDWAAISRNAFVTWKHVQEHVDLPWHWPSFLANPNFTWALVQSLPLLRTMSQFHGELLSLNPNLTPEIVATHPDVAWDAAYLACNRMERGRAFWLHATRLRHIKAWQLQRHWRRCSCDPRFALAQRCVWRRYHHTTESSEKELDVA